MSKHEEFPPLTPEAWAAYSAAFPCATYASAIHRKAFAAFLREAIRQADPNPGLWFSRRLTAIANNLHSPPPPPPTLAQAREADLSTPAGRHVVRDFLATLGEGEP